MAGEKKSDRTEVTTSCADCLKTIKQYRYRNRRFNGRVHRCARCAWLLWRKNRGEPVRN